MNPHTGGNCLSAVVSGVVSGGGSQ